MSALEQLRPFVSFCQAIGFIPYTMECDPNSKRLLKFAFSWRNQTTWWFIFMGLLQLTVPFRASQFSDSVIKKLAADRKAPITISILMGVTVLCYIVQLILSRWIVLRHYRPLQKTVEFAFQAEKLIRPYQYEPSQSRVIRRFVIGFCLLAISVQFSFSSTQSVALF